MITPPDVQIADSDVSAVALPLNHARHRQMQATLILDSEDRVTLLNGRAVKLLRDLCDGQIDGKAFELPSTLQALIPEMRRRLHDRTDTSAVALLTVEICARACLLLGPAGQHLMFTFERIQRRDAVQHNLERYALTPRERDVVTLVLFGYSNRRIADQLFLAEYTVEDHLKRVFVKLGVRTRTALAAKILGWRENS